MALINWDNSLSVNVSKVDTQHQKLIQLINNLNDAMKQGKGKDVVGNILNELVNYTKVHFKMEEDIFEQYGYPNKAAHINEHTNFVKKIMSFSDDYQSGRLGLSVELLNFLVSWLKNHIMVVDKKYSEFFNSKGIV